MKVYLDVWIGTDNSSAKTFAAVVDADSFDEAVIELGNLVSAYGAKLQGLTDAKD